MGSSRTTWAWLVSWFPATAPAAMPNRIAMGVAGWWDPVVALALTLAAIAGLVVVGARRGRNGTTAAGDEDASRLAGGFSVLAARVVRATRPPRRNGAE
jgi:ABC-2 type transport system permease protein